MALKTSNTINQKTPGCVAIVVAAGRGARAGTDQPKQYVKLGGKALIRHTLQVFCSHPSIGAVLPVIHPDDAALFAEATEGLHLMAPVSGGETRQESVRLGLESLAALSPQPEVVLIHDAARAFVSPSLVSKVILALDNHKGAIPALRVVDTLKRENPNSTVNETLERDGIWRAQTPQGFHFPDILTAHRDLMAETLTDDSAIAERAELDVALVEGEESNVKITTTADMDNARHKLSSGEIRIGSGFDVHRFCAGDYVTLCGIEIPHTQALEGHSDSDVAMHALTDSILGAMAEGDIGSHFPPTEEQWKDAASEIFLKSAATLLAARGGRIVNVDVTIICEAPKIGPHRTAMVDCLAGILGIVSSRISVKATTTEKLGFTGRGEGIASQAVATIELP